MAIQQRKSNQLPSTDQTPPEMPERVTTERVRDYEVYDPQGNLIGGTTAIWMDTQGQPAFLGIRTSRILGRTHVIPAWGGEVNHRARRIRILCSKDTLEGAPAAAPESALDASKERQIIDYFKANCSPAHVPSPARDSAPEETVIPLHEEEVKVGKRVVEVDGVRLRKVVRTETVQQPVELKRETIEVERVPADGNQPSAKAFQAEDIYIPLRREEPVVEKQTRVREAVRARKNASTEHQTVSGEIRKEDVEVQREQTRNA